ncbi:M23 family metallopeptidase [Saccharopolyspora griseoalba]|uniref:M23 family metallopeptidase n=1 Tax=Saccharopolyspora griseoalba TaxID=1431848 RepID=A0ABW2LKT1_9PSEU
MKFMRKLAATSALAVAAAATMVSAGAGEALAEPDFQMPFECGYTAVAATYGGHSPANSVDFQKSGISGDAVVASAGGTVSVVGDEGDESYGKWIEIDHGGGWTTRYAHLSAQSVGQGDEVRSGEKIGEAGNTGGSTGAHLHYEQRLDGADEKVVLDGAPVPYYGKTEFTSNNCGGGSGNPHSPGEVCGDGYSVVDSHQLGEAGEVYLLYNGDSGKNCVTALKAEKLDRRTPVSAFLEVRGADRKTDSGEFQYYAGPVRASAAQTCVKWGGSIGSAEYSSDFEHCG